MNLWNILIKNENKLKVRVQTLHLIQKFEVIENNEF